MRRHLAWLLVITMVMALMAFGAANTFAQEEPCVPGNPFHPCQPECVPGNPFHPCPTPSPTCVPAPNHPCDGPTENIATCRASAVRVENFLINLEPFVANDQNFPCTDDDASLIPPTTIGPVSAAALVAQTFADPDPPANPTTATAVAGAAGVSALGITVLAANSFATADCTGPTPVFTGESVVVGVFTPGGNILVPSGHQDIPIPLLGTLHLNETIVEPNRITVRAVWLDTSPNPLTPDVIIGEAIADCEPAAGPTPTPTPTHAP